MFSLGMKTIKTHEDPIKKEWNELLLSLQSRGNKTKHIASKSIDLFEYYFFCFEGTHSEWLIRFKEEWNHQIGITHANHLIMLLIENAVHRTLHKNMTENTSLDYQAVQYIFTEINTHLGNKQQTTEHSAKSFLKELVQTTQLPIEWIVVTEQINNQKSIRDLYTRINVSNINYQKLTAKTSFELGDILLKTLNQQSAHLLSVFSIPFEKTSLLFAIDKARATDVLPFVYYSIHMFEQTKQAITNYKFNNQWKDSVIMFNDTIIKSRTFDEVLSNVTSGFVNYLPFKRCALFSYSVTEQKSFGLAGYELDPVSVQNIEEHINNLPILKNGLSLLTLFGVGMKSLHPLYLANAKTTFPKSYIDDFKMESLVIAPIFTEKHGLIGAALLDQGPNKEFSISQETFSALIKFGQTAGETLAKFNLTDLGLNEAIPHFSPREIQILKLMANGMSTSASALELNLSDYTVRDYISSIIKKMNAKNRTEAVARAIRKGII